MRLLEVIDIFIWCHHHLYVALKLDLNQESEHVLPQHTFVRTLPVFVHHGVVVNPRGYYSGYAKNKIIDHHISNFGQFH